MCIHGCYAPDTVLVRRTEQRLGTRVDKHSQTNVYKKMIALNNKSLLLSEYFHSLLFWNLCNKVGPCNNYLSNDLATVLSPHFYTENA